MVAARGLGWGKRGVVQRAQSFGFARITVLEVEGGDGCTTVQMGYTFKYDEDDKLYVMCILPQLNII